MVKFQLRILFEQLCKNLLSNITALFLNYLFSLVDKSKSKYQCGIMFVFLSYVNAAHRQYIIKRLVYENFLVSVPCLTCRTEVGSFNTFSVGN